MREGYEKREDLDARRRIAEEMFGGIRWVSPTRGFGRCPGEGAHSGKRGGRDFRVLLDGVPNVKCFHASCLAIVEAAKKTLRSKIGKAECVRISAPSGNGPRKRTFAPGRPTPFKRRGPKEIRGIRMEDIMRGDFGDPNPNTSHVTRILCQEVAFNVSEVSETGGKHAT